MKKILILFLATGLLTACSETPNGKSEKQSSEEIAKQEAIQPMTVEEATELIEYTGMGEGDKLVSATVENGEIKAVIELVPHDLLPVKDLAVARYSQASDELLDHEGWKVLTIEYVDVGTISMNSSEKETNEYDMDYFSTAEIEKRLK